MVYTVSVDQLAQALKNLVKAKIPELQGFRRQVNHHLKLIRKYPKRFNILEKRTKQYYAHCQLKLLQHRFTFDEAMDPLIHLNKRLLHFAEHDKKLDVDSAVFVNTFQNKIFKIILKCIEARKIMKMANDQQFDVEERFNEFRGQQNELLKKIKHAKELKAEMKEYYRKYLRELIGKYKHLMFIYSSTIDCPYINI